MASAADLVFDQVHAEKHRLPGETYEDSSNRISAALHDSEEHRRAFRRLLLEKKFWPGGRIQAWAGSGKDVTPYNCFVSGVIHDSFVDGPNNQDLYGGPDLTGMGPVSISRAAMMAAQTMRRGGGIGYDFSTLRPAGDIIKGVQSKSDGPLAFLPIFDANCKATSSAGNRRGAMMGVLRIDHPDIESFIRIKNDQTRLSGFNLSIAVTDEFMECLATGRAFPLRFGDKIYRETDPQMLWEMVMRSTWDWAEPGVLFIDTINRMNNLRYCETIFATNPCAEQPLPPYGACLLGSSNLLAYVVQTGPGVFSFDMEAFKADIPVFVRAMDLVVDRASYPLLQQRTEAHSKRRMGLGVFGLANALEACGAIYGDAEFLRMEAAILTTLRDEAYRASVQLAKEKGAFPLFNAEHYLAAPFIKTLPDDIRDGIRKYGIRNSHLLSIAPTGTISFAAGNVSGGIEPVFAYTTERLLKMPSGDQLVTVRDAGVDKFGSRGSTTDEVTIDEHLGVLITAAKLVDSSVSKTINLTGQCSWDDFKAIYTRAYDGGAKGCTTFNKDGKKMALLKSKDTKTVEEEAPKVEACFYDPDTGQKSCS